MHGYNSFCCLSRSIFKSSNLVSTRYEMASFSGSQESTLTSEFHLGDCHHKWKREVDDFKSPLPKRTWTRWHLVSARKCREGLHRGELVPARKLPIHPEDFKMGKVVSYILYCQAKLGNWYGWGYAAFLVYEQIKQPILYVHWGFLLQLLSMRGSKSATVSFSTFCTPSISLILLGCYNGQSVLVFLQIAIPALQPHQGTFSIMLQLLRKWTD